MLGSAFVFFMRKEIPDRLQKTLLGFASGVMLAASVWSLLIPAIEMMTHSSALTGTSPNLGEEFPRVLPAAVGVVLG